MSIRILLADDHKIMREGLRALLESEPDMEVVGEAENGRKAVQLAREIAPDVVVMDVTMPGLNGIEATRQIASEFPGVKVITLSMHHHDQFVAGMFQVGAVGYLLKDNSIEELARAIRVVVAGKVYVSPGVASIVIKDYVRQLKESGKSVPPLLTPRETEVLQLVSEGKTSKEIASIMHISAKTVDTHRRQMMAKLNVSSIAQLTKYAIRSGLTSLDT